MKTFLYLLFTMTICSSAARAEEVYPQYPPIRKYGLNQSVTGSCVGDATTMSIEHFLSERQIIVPVSRFHLFYNYAVQNWWQQPEQITNEVLRDTASNQLNKAWGRYIPAIFNPEDNIYSVSTEMNSPRPSPAITGYYPEQLKHTVNFAYNNFTKIRASDSPIEYLKDLVRKKQGVHVSVDGDIFEKEYFDHLTGLPNRPAEMMDLLTINHRVAILGFDDALGGFITRNTWNSRERIAKMNRYGNNNPALAKFKAKIPGQSKVGYYLIPYDYIRRVAEQRGLYVAVVNVEDVNQLLDWSKELKIVRSSGSQMVPTGTLALYSCDDSELKSSLDQLGQIVKNLKSASQTRSSSQSELKAIVDRQMLLAGPNQLPLFAFARTTYGFNSSGSLIGPLRNLYGRESATANYYCGSAGNKVWPDTSSPEFNWYFKWLKADGLQAGSEVYQHFTEYRGTQAAERAHWEKYFVSLGKAYNDRSNSSGSIK